MRIQPIFNTPIQNRNTSYRKQQLGIQPPKNTGKDISFEAIRFPAFANTNMDQVVNIYKAIREYHLGITPAQAQELNKRDGFDFLQGALDFLCDRFYIPRSIGPLLGEKTDSRPYIMEFNPIENSIIINSAYINSEKKHIFGGMRHEFEHYFRRLLMFQHEVIGPQYIEELSNAVVIDMQKDIYAALQNPTKENMQKLEQNPYYKEKYNQIKELFDQRKFVDIAKKFILEKVNQVEKFKKYRAKVIERFGEVKKDSPMSSKIQQIYEDNINANYQNEKGSIDVNLYTQSKEELATISAQTSAAFEYDMALKKPDIPESSRTGAISYLRYIANAKEEADLFEFKIMQQFIR